MFEDTQHAAILVSAFLIGFFVAAVISAQSCQSQTADRARVLEACTAQCSAVPECVCACKEAAEAVK